MIVEDINILFVGNFQLSMEKIEHEIASFLPENINYNVLTYKKSDIKLSYSYENYLLKNYDYIDRYPMEFIRNKYQDTNLYLSLVSERSISNYYYGIENSLGNKDLNYNEMIFMFKSFILFLEQYIEKCEIVFSSYADNFISTLTYYLCKHYNKKCIAFHEISVVDSDSNFLVEGIYAKPYHNLIIHEKPKTYSELISFMKNYNGAKDRENRYKKNKVFTKRSLYGSLSANLFDVKYIKFALFGYQVSDNKIKPFMNIDKPDIWKKLKANLYRLVNKKLVENYIKKFDFKPDKESKYIYFPLQIQPEASTSSRVPFYMNQLATIENISKSLPLGYKLLIKEHPLGIGMNGLHFYKKIISIPNIEFVNNTISGREIIKVSDLIIGFGGTTLFESVLEGKKVLMLLPDYYYSDCKYIFKVEDKNNLYFDIIRALKFTISKDEIQEEKEKMLNFFYQRGFPRFVDFEKNMADNLMKIYEMEKKNG